MKLKTIIWTSALIAIGAAQQPQVAKNFRWQGGDTVIDVVGVCQLTEESVTCWKPDRTLDKDLADTTRALAISNYSGMMIRVGRKNRLLVVRYGGPRYGPQAVRPSDWSLEDGVQLNQTYQLNASDLPETYWYAFTADRSKSETTVTASYSSYVDEPVKLAAAAGSKAQGVGVSFELIDWRRSENAGRKMNGVHWDPQWTATIVAKGLGENQTVQGALAWKDPNRHYYVDEKGRPVPYAGFDNPARVGGHELRRPSGYLVLLDRMPGLANGPSGLNPVTFKFNAGSGGAHKFEFTTNVDPDALGGISLAISRRSAIRFEGVPLDPAP